MADNVARALALAALEYKESHDKGDYNEIKNKPYLNGKMILGSHNAEYYNLPLLNETANKISLLMDSESYILRAQLKDKSGNVIDSASIDLPLEEMIMEGRYEEDSEEGYLVLVLHNGNEIRIPLSGLIDELATIEYVDFQDDYLESLIDSEKAVRKAKDDELLLLINSEEDARILGDSELGERIDVLEADLNSETQARIAGDSELLVLINSEADLRKAEDDLLHSLLDSEAMTREEADFLLQSLLDSETDARSAKDEELEDLITSEGQLWRAEVIRLDNALDSESTLRIAGDSDLQAQIDNLVLDLDSESMEILKRALSSDLDAERDARILGDSELTIRINGLEEDLTSEGILRAEEDERIIHLLDSEAMFREQGDSENRVLILQEIADRTSEGQRLEELINSKTVDVDDETVKKDSEGNIYVPIDEDTIFVNSEGKLEALFQPSYINGHEITEDSTTESLGIFWYGTSEQYAALVSEGIDEHTLYIVEDDNDPLIQTTTYNRLVDKPQINGQTLSGDKSLASLGIQPTMNGVTPIDISANQVSLRYNEEQFYIGANNKLFYYDKVDGFVPDISFANRFSGIYGGINVNKYASGLYSGSIKFMSLDALTAGTAYKVADAFGDTDASVSFDSFALGFDDLTYTPMCVRIEDGEVWIYPTINIPARGIVGFSFLASV